MRAGGRPAKLTNKHLIREFVVDVSGPTAETIENEACWEITRAGRWRAVVNAHLFKSLPLPVSALAFDTYWIVAGDRIREQVAADRLLAGFLRKVLPPYEGGQLTLFRGENLDRLKSGRIGFAWTQRREFAEMFAAGLNACGSGGAVITATLDSSAIICGPNAHSEHLGEGQFTADPFRVTDARIVGTFPPSK
jgi:hypothetical protein